jgi:hypothetical protein
MIPFMIRTTSLNSQIKQRSGIEALRIWDGSCPG